MIYEEINGIGLPQNLKFVKGTIFLPKMDNIPLRIYNEEGKMVFETDREDYFSYIRAQILFNNCNGWSFEFNGNKYDIDSKGMIPKWNEEIFGIENYCENRLLNW